VANRGVDVTQATLSRDIRELKLIKMHDPEGATIYSLPPEEWDNAPALTQLLPALYLGAEGTGNGGTQAVSEAIEWEEWPEVLGTLAPLPPRATHPSTFAAPTLRSHRRIRRK